MGAWQNVLDERDAPGLVPAGTVIQSAALNTPSSYLPCDGSAITRAAAAHAALFAAITISQAGAVVNGTPQVTGLSDTSKMVAGYPVSGPAIPVGTIILSVDSSSQITLNQNATATGTITICVAPFGVGDGSTTFNVPLLSSNFVQASGGIDILGGTGGNLSPPVTDPGHSHTIVVAGTKPVGAGGPACVVTNTTAGSTTGITVADGRPPFLVLNFYIKL